MLSGYPIQITIELFFVIYFHLFAFISHLATFFYESFPIDPERRTHDILVWKRKWVKIERYIRAGTHFHLFYSYLHFIKSSWHFPGRYRTIGIRDVHSHSAVDFATVLDSKSVGEEAIFFFLSVDTRWNFSRTVEHIYCVLHYFKLC